MPRYKLTYLDLRDIAEPIRLMLTYMKEEFEEVRIPLGQWLPVKDSTPFGKLPILEIDGKVYHQSAAICRYLANESKLYGLCPLEDLEIDQIVESVGDLREEVFKVVRAPNPKIREINRQTVINEVIPFYFRRYEEAMNKNRGYLVNGRLTWADFYLVGYAECLPSILKIDFMGKYHRYCNLCTKIRELPGIWDYMVNRPDTIF